MSISFRNVLVVILSVVLTNAVMAQDSGGRKNKKKKKDTKSELPAVNQGLLDSLAADFVWVTGGKFIMGDYGGDADEKPAYEVTVDGFAISKYPVTQRQWAAIMGSNPSQFTGCDQCPVDMVSWDDAQRFIEILNKVSGKNYALPTEAEWEYAAKGGLKTRGFRYSGSDDINAVGWFTGNSGRHPHPVGEKAPNELGLYDMTGNVWEWCRDWYNKNYYELRESNNPTGPSSGSGRVRRGGSWFTQEVSCRTSTRNSVKQDYKDDSGGFRLVQYPN
ncbi:MAG TPA: formylglycine-generating enzyme family protein [Agriterribacter sp.]|nr:formylglycine-generating enzyme family protein [Chitinophagaceae bacterium]HRP32995.1 formylglycine-generating enzyme family protein [Agriterribacter sp.]